MKNERLYENIRGFTLLEILLSITILAMIVPPFIGLFTQTVRINTFSEKSLKLSALIQQESERLMADSYLELLRKMSNGRRDIGDYSVQHDILPYHPEDQENLVFDIIIKEPGKGQDNAYIVPPKGLPSVITMDENTTSLVVNFSQRGSSFDYALTSYHENSIDEQSTSSYSDHTVSGKNIILNIYTAEKPNPLPLALILDQFDLLSDLSIHLWDDHFHQNEFSIHYRGFDGNNQVVTISNPIPASGEPPFRFLYTNCDAHRHSFVKTKVRIYEDTTYPEPLAERTVLSRVRQ